MSPWHSPWTNWGFRSGSRVLALSRILAVAGEYKLRLMVACQHMGQLPSELQQALRTSTALRVYFRFGIDDAKAVASTLSAGRGYTTEYITQLQLKRRLNN